MKSRWIASLSLALVAAVAPCASAGLIITGNSATAGPSSLTHTVALVTNPDSNPDTLTIIVAGRDFNIPMGSVFGQYVADADFLTGSGSVTLSGYVDPTNTPIGFGGGLHGAEVLIGTADESNVPFIALLPLTLSPPYGLTLTASFTLQPLSSLSFTHTVSVIPAAEAVPEPGTAVLLAAALLVGGVIRGLRLRA